MRKILEYRVFDLLKDKDNEKFLNKVKKENRDLYAKFLTILGNKGLEVAKKEYEYYDPNYVKIQKEKEKAQSAIQKKEKSKEFKEEMRKIGLDLIKDEVDEVEDILDKTVLKSIIKRINSDVSISTYLKSCGAKKQYKNEFLDIIKHPQNISLSRSFIIDSLRYGSQRDQYWDTGAVNHIKIIQYYNLSSKELTYSINFDMSYESIGIDSNKEMTFIRDRDRFISTLNKYSINIQELNDILFNKLSSVLSEDTYRRWFADWEIKQDTNKYNI